MFNDDFQITDVNRAILKLIFLVASLSLLQLEDFYGWSLHDMFVLMKNLYVFSLMKLIQEI